MRSKIVLLVDDNDDDIELALRAFRIHHLANEVIVAKDGIEALDFLHCRGEHHHRDPDHLPEVVLLDLKMPRMDGLEVLRRIREDERTKWLPVVIMTSSTEEEDLARSYESGANSYIRKPVDFSRFVEAVRELGLYWLTVNQGPPLPTPDPQG